MSDTVTGRDIREYMGHGEGNRRVRIKRDGTIEYYGSTLDTDRDHDWWHYGGTRAELVRNVEYWNEHH